MTEHTGERPEVEAPQRTFAPRPPARVRNPDGFDLAIKLKAALWGGAIGAVGTLVSMLLALKAEAEPPWSYLFWLGGPLTGVLVYKMVMGITEGSGAAVGKIHNPSGSSTPAVREYSRAQALEIQGNYREAIEVYEDAVTIHPDDPEPYVKIARLHRDRLHQLEEAVSWFKRARTESKIEAGREMLVTQEIIEIYRLKLDQPKRAIPELARLIDKFPDHPSAEAARRELADLKRTVAEEER